LYDTGNWDGKAIYEGGYVTISVPASVLDNYSHSQVEAIVKHFTPPGVQTKVEYT